MRHWPATSRFFRMGFVEKKTVNHWNDIKQRQRNDCRNLEIFTTGKIFAFGRRSDGFQRHSVKYVCKARMKIYVSRAIEP